MPPVDWARPVTLEEDGPVLSDADGLALGDADGDGCAAVEDVFGFRPVKSEPRMSSTVPGLRLASCRPVTPESSFLSVFTSARSAEEEYSITELV
jgi:hypothetical protein